MWVVSCNNIIFMIYRVLLHVAVSTLSALSNSGPGCSKLTTLLVNFVKISNVNIAYMPMFFLEKM